MEHPNAGSSWRLLREKVVPAPAAPPWAPAAQDEPAGKSTYIPCAESLRKPIGFDRSARYSVS